MTLRQAQGERAFDSLPRHEIALVLDGKAYLGWTALAIDRGIDTLTGSFELELTAKEKTGLPDFPVKAGDACEVALGGKALITGYVDAVSRSLAAEDRTLRVTGRDKAADLVDCSALNQPGSWRNAKLETIAKELAQPFGIALKFTGDTGGALKRFAIQPGETAWAAIERVARYRGLIAFSDGQGGVTVGNPDSGRRAGRIAQGLNLLSIESGDNQAERFSVYVLKGQASGDDETNGKAVAQIKGEARDSGVKRHRPLLIVGEEQSDAASLEKRAKWEAVTRAARGETHSVSVPGWFGGDDVGSAAGPVWEPGARAELDVPSHKLSGDRLIERVRLVRDDGGTRSELTLVPPEAWTQLAEPEPKT